MLRTSVWCGANPWQETGALMPTVVDFGSVSLVANQVPVYVPNENGQTIPPGQNFTNVEVHVTLGQIPAGTYLSWDVDWSLETGASTNWDHNGGFAGFLPTNNKDGTLATEAIVGLGIPANSRRGRLHIKEVTQNSTISVSVTAFP